jgi:hypothetical protein
MEEDQHRLRRAAFDPTHGNTAVTDGNMGKKR